jgi:hypothetical protein
LEKLRLELVSHVDLQPFGPGSAIRSLSLFELCLIGTCAGRSWCLYGQTLATSFPRLRLLEIRGAFKFAQLGGTEVIASEVLDHCNVEVTAAGIWGHLELLENLHSFVFDIRFGSVADEHTRVRELLELLKSWRALSSLVIVTRIPAGDELANWRTAFSIGRRALETAGFNAVEVGWNRMHQITFEIRDEEGELVNRIESTGADEAGLVDDMGDIEETIVLQS